MTNKLVQHGKDCYIKIFVSGGCKCYCYCVVVPGSDQVFETCKIKGITLNYINKQKINLETIKSMVENGNTVETESRNIRRVDYYNVVTTTERKKCKVTSTKRWFINNGLSVPYGYKRQRLE